MKTQQEIDDLLNNLDRHLKLLPQLGKENIQVPPGFYMFDIYTTGLLNRAVNIIRAFCSLMRDRNFIAAAPLVRIHLDSLLRLFAPQLISFNVDEFATLVFKGTPVRKIKDKTDKRLTDAHLVESISKEDGFEWVQRVYDTGNSYVHFSDMTIFASMQALDEPGKINFTVGQHDHFISLNDKHGAAFWMNKITEGIILLTHSWIEQKKGYLQNGG